MSKPIIVFRGDSRPFGVIFREGFTAWEPGASVRLEDYVNRNQPSQYISTSASYFAPVSLRAAYLKKAKRKPPGGGLYPAVTFSYYVYEIHTTNAHFDVSEIVGPNQYLHQAEIAVVGPIPPAQIKCCREYTGAADGGRDGSIEIDPPILHPNPFWNRLR